MLRIEIRREIRPEAEPFGCLVVNDHHIWRFETMTAAILAASNLSRSVKQDPLHIVLEPEPETKRAAR